MLPHLFHASLTDTDLRILNMLANEMQGCQRAALPPYLHKLKNMRLGLRGGPISLRSQPQIFQNPVLYVWVDQRGVPIISKDIFIYAFAAHCDTILGVLLATAQATIDHKAVTAL